MVSAFNQPLVAARSVGPAAASLRPVADRRLARLRREAALHGTGFWIRPMLIEILTGVGLAWLYWWEVDQGGVLPFAVFALNAPFRQLCLHLEFISHAILITLMLAASMIDVDEKTIPDEITVVGTLVGLFLAAARRTRFCPTPFLPVRLESRGTVLT